MTAIGLIFSRSGRPVESAAIARLEQRLQHYGKPSTDSSVGCHIANYPSVSSVGKQSIRTRGDDLFAFAGRISNRAEFVESPGQEDVDIAASLYQQGGAEALARISSGFILCVYQRHSNQLTLIRDPLGDQPLYYWLDKDYLIAASEPAAVLTASGISPQPDHRRIAVWLQNQWPAINNSYFRNIHTLRPGHLLETGWRHHHCRQYWIFQPDDSVATEDPATIHEWFRETLKTAVRDCIGDESRVALSLSGGLDSASIAASLPDTANATAWSWTFETNPEHNEQSQVSLLARHLGLDVEYVDGSQTACRFDSQAHADGIDLNGPHLNTVIRLKRALYGGARDAGNRVMLVGDSADELYLGRHYWLRDLFRHRRVGQGMIALPGAAWRWLRGDFEAWLPLRMLAGNRLGLRRYLPDESPAWLSEFCADQITRPVPSPLVPRALQHELAYDFAIGHYRATYMTYELGQLARIGIERRSPYRDRRVVELMLSLPAWYYTQPPRNKVVVRDAFATRLPETISAAEKRGSLTFLTEQSLIDHRAVLVDYLLSHQDWQQYLNAPLVIQELHAVTRSSPGQTMQYGKVPYGVIWNAICLQNWFDLVKDQGNAR